VEGEVGETSGSGKIVRKKTKKLIKKTKYAGCD